MLFQSGLTDEQCIVRTVSRLFFASALSELLEPGDSGPHVWTCVLEAVREAMMKWLRIDPFGRNRGSTNVIVRSKQSRLPTCHDRVQIQWR